MKLTTNQKGDIGVARVTADLISRGHELFMPVDAKSAFDLLVKVNENYQRVQVKYANPRGGVLKVDVRRAIIHKTKITLRANLECDIVAIYCPTTDKCYYVEAVACVSLRVTPAKNGQTVHIRYVTDYVTFPPCG